MRGRSLIFVAVILPAGALAQDSAPATRISAPATRISMITHERIDRRDENRFTGFEGRGGTPVQSGKIVRSRAATIPCQETPFNL